MRVTAPELLDWISKVVSKYVSTRDDSDIGDAKKLIAKAADPRYRD